MTYATYRLTAKNRDQLRNPTLGNRVWATFLLISYFNDILAHFDIISAKMRLIVTDVPWSLSVCLLDTTVAW